jgi:hypothetical protein
LTLYPRLGELLKRRLNMELFVDKSEPKVLTMLVKGFTPDEFFEMREKIYRAEFK